MASPLERIARRAGRAVIGLFYIISGIGIAQDHVGVIQLMTAKGVPVPALLLAITVGVWWIGGLGLVTGYRARWAALLLLVFTIPVTAYIHNFWAADTSQFQNQMTHCLKNIALLGSLLFIAAVSSDPPARAGQR